MNEAKDRDAESYNRLFILGGKGCSEETFRKEFGKFGHITDIYIMKDKGSGEDRGIVYITFDKISEAALALEEMNGQTIPGNPKPLKVLIANSKSKGNTREPEDDEKLFRLFIMVPKDYTEDTIRDIFQQYGKIDYIRLLKDKHTGDSKGLAYVKYFKQYHAALAYENCNPAFKPIFASTQSSKSKSEHRSSSDRRSSHESEPPRPIFYPQYPPANGYSVAPAPPRIMVLPVPQNECDLHVQFANGLPTEQVRALCDLIPGLDYCQYDRHTGVAFVRYMTPVSASHAKHKLEKLEYPPGYSIKTLFASEAARMGPQGIASGFNGSDMSSVLQNMQRLTELGSRDGTQADLLNLAQHIQKAAEVVMQQAGLAGGKGGALGMDRPTYCNFNVPHPQPLAPKDAPMAERLFIVSQPDPIPENCLCDLFCRFGNLIDAYFLPGKNYGYAKFASKESAVNAMDALHGKEVCGMRLKLAHAEPPKTDRGDSKYDRSENGHESKRARRE